MIYITGDTHGCYDRFAEIEETYDLKKGDSLIICGDFGFIFTSMGSIKHYPYYKNQILRDIANEDEILDLLSEKEYNILFIDGNHEAFPRIIGDKTDAFKKDVAYDPHKALSEDTDYIDTGFPEEEWNGGKIHRIRHNVIHLMRGQVFTIEGKKFFTFGGAFSTDRGYRKRYYSFWDEEIPSKEEMEEAKINLSKNNHIVDYIITHTVPTSVIRQLHFETDDKTPDAKFTNFLDDYVRVNVSYKKWFAGHFHMDKYANYSDNIRLLYKHVIPID